MSEENDIFLARLRTTFRLEVVAHLAAARRLVDALECRQSEGDAVAPLRELIREVHSLKGAAGAVEHGELEYLCRSLEQVLFRLQRKEIQYSPPLFAMLHQSHAVIERIILRDNEVGSLSPAGFYDDIRKIVDVDLQTACGAHPATPMLRT